MRLSVCGVLTAAVLGMALASPASAQNKPSIAIMPAQYFAADAASADNVTRGLARQYEGQGYQVIPVDRSTSTFQSMGLSTNMHYADRVAVKFGRQMGADLVAYPRLLAVGLPISSGELKGSELLQPAAVAHLRVINVHTGQAIYFRQIAHDFTVDMVTPIAEFRLPEPIAVATADEVTQMYFQRVAGSRQEFRR